MTRWMPFVFACLVGALVGQGSESSPAVNLLDNPSFEALDGVGGPIGWTQSTWSGLPVFSVEGLAGFARTGRRCLKVSSTEGADASWSFKVGVRPHTRYRLSAWVRTRGLDRRSGRGAQLNLQQLPASGLQYKFILSDLCRNKLGGVYFFGLQRAQ